MAGMKVVLCPDSLKTTATAPEAATYLAEGIADTLPGVELVLVPLADGGEGTSACFSGERITLPTTTAIGRLTEATYTFDGTTAYIDCAAASGFIHDNEPLTADTFGTGVLIADAHARGATRIALGLGGTATTDGGTGILAALGATPLDQAGHPLRPGGAALVNLDSIDTAQLNIPAAAVEWILLSDVTSPAPAAAEVFAPQKGASPKDVALLAAGIKQLCAVTGIDPSTPGMGAAGGVAIGITWLSALLHGQPRVTILPGAATVAEAVGLDQHLAGADAVVTAEGRYDATSTAGKVVSEVLRRAASVPRRFVVAGQFHGEPDNATAITLGTGMSSVAEQLRAAGRTIGEQLAQG